MHADAPTKRHAIAGGATKAMRDASCWEMALPLTLRGGNLIPARTWPPL
jgi:hypothetical protein